MTNNREVEWIREAAEEFPGGGVDRRRMILDLHPTEHDPIILWGEDWFRRGAFDWHAHRGFATISYVREGTMEHANSLGDHGFLGPSDVLWTVAGEGLFHDGQAIADEIVHGTQMWVNLPAASKMSAPAEIPIPAATAPSFGDKSMQGRVYLGTCNGVDAPVTGLSPMTFVEFKFKTGTTTIDLPHDQRGALYVMSGVVQLNGLPIPAGHTASFSAGGGKMELAALSPGIALLAAGRAIKEPVVVDGPFVMNTSDEIRQAYADLEAGLMGAPPAGVNGEEIPA